MTLHSEKSITDGEGMSVDNLILRNGTYHVRVRVPPELQKAMGRNEFTKSLKTGSKVEANVKKLPIIAAIRAEIDKFKKQENPPKGDFEEMAFNFAKRITTHNQEKIVEIATNQESISYYDTNAGVMNKGLWNKRQEMLLLHNKNITQNEYDKREKFLEEWMTKWTAKSTGHPFTGPSNLSMSEKIQAEAELSAGIANNDAMDKIDHYHNLKPAQKERAKEILSNPSLFTPKSDFSDSRLEEFAAYQKNVRKVIDKTVDMQVSRLKVLRAYFSDNKVECTHKTVRQWIESEQTLSSKTKKQYILSGNTFYKWGINNVAEFEEKYQNSKPPFQDHEFPIARTGKAQKEGKRKTYSVEQVELLYSKAKEIKGKNRQPLLDAIRIGSHTGMRIEEICKLEINRDLIDDEGVYSFSLDDGKNESAIRNIPVHPDILPVVKRMIEESKDGFLMPSPGGNKYDIRSDYLSKAFGRLKTANGFGPQYVFHSFRGTVITQLQRKHVPPLTIVSIVGHESGTVTFDIYSAGASAEQKFEAIKNITYNFD